MLNNTGLTSIFLLPKQQYEVTSFEKELMENGFKFSRNWTCFVKTYESKRDVIPHKVSLV